MKGGEGSGQNKRGLCRALFEAQPAARRTMWPERSEQEVGWCQGTSGQQGLSVVGPWGHF